MSGFGVAWPSEAPSRANSPARLLRRLFFDPRGCVWAADQALRPDPL